MVEAREYNIRTCQKCGNNEGNIIEAKKEGYKVICDKCNNLIFEKQY